MRKMEPYTVEIPDELDLKASGVKIGTLSKSSSPMIFFVQSIQQRVFMSDLIAGVTEYLKHSNFGIEYVLYDPEYDRFEFKVEHLLIPRKISDNPQA